jgi:hypothetical protein
MPLRTRGRATENRPFEAGSPGVFHPQSKLITFLFCVFNVCAHNKTLFNQVFIVARRAKTPGPEMINAVSEMLRKLEGISADPSIIGSCPELPGIVLDKIEGSCLDRDGADYNEVNRDFENLRAEYLQALVAHPVGRGLALVAVGPEGVAMMEAGRPPSSISNVLVVQGRPMRGRHETFNCHHIVPKSVQATSSAISVNHPTNFVIAKTTRRGRDQSENPHHFWHSLILHPQLHDAPDKSIPIFVVRPLFPFYPPITQGYRNVQELRKKLASAGAPPLPEIWEKRVLEFSKASNHRPYCVPKEFHEITRMFGDLFKAENKDAAVNQELRATLAKKGAMLAAEFLPAGAYLNGKQLPPEHKPKRVLPVIETIKEPETPLAKPKLSKTRARKNQRRNAVAQPKARHQAV